MHYILLVNIVLIDNKLKINELQAKRSKAQNEDVFKSQ